MNLQEYKLARENSRITVLENWCRVIRISEDTHRSISAGRMDISDAIADRIRQFEAEAVKWAEDLRAKLETAAADINPNVSVTVEGPTRDIFINFEAGKSVLVRNCGVDTMNAWAVYNINRDKKTETVILRARVPPWKKGAINQEPTHDWYLWRGAFGDHRQSYWNDIDSATLQQCITATS